MRDFALGPTVGFALWRFGVGGGLFFDVLNVDRVTHPEVSGTPTTGTLTAVNLGVRLHLTFDVLQWGAPVEWGKSGGLFVGVEGAASGLGGATYGGPTFFAGVRAF